eukprot:4878591-Amphidinium_carterae.1
MPALKLERVARLPRRFFGKLQLLSRSLNQNRKRHPKARPGGVLAGSFHQEIRRRKEKVQDNGDVR